MSVNCYVVLPPQTKVTDVLNAIGGLAGNQTTAITHSHGYDAFETYEWSGRSPDGKKKCDVPKFATAYKGQSPDHCFMYIPAWNDPDIEPGQMHQALYSFETDYRRAEPGGRSLYLGSTAWWVAVAFRLVEMFGGKVVADDCSDKLTRSVKREDSAIAAIERKYRKSDPTLGNEGWGAVQAMTMCAEPISAAELKKADRFAYYKMEA